MTTCFNSTNFNGFMLGRDFPFTGFSALVMSEHSSSGSQLTILLSQASVKPCFFFSFVFVYGNEIFPYIVCLKYPYKNINGKVVAPKIQKNLTTSCCIAKVASQVFFLPRLVSKDIFQACSSR